jgi:folate-dependent phosphoribosylglycinamide formyltransferase PurN
MKGVLLTNGQGNQIALANKIADVIELEAVVVSANTVKSAKSASFVKLLGGKVANVTVGRTFRDVWFNMLGKYHAAFTKFPSENIVNVSNINDAETLQTIKDIAPDVVLVSGTNLLGRKLIAECNKMARILNLHTGISPYVKGGPNCTNWCLARNWFHLIGNTIMWLDEGVDTGAVIFTERTPLTGRESLDELHWAVMEHAHDLYKTAVAELRDAKELNSIEQRELGEGHHFRSADWTYREMYRAYKNFKNNYSDYFANTSEREKLEGSVRLFPRQGA